MSPPSLSVRGGQRGLFKNDYYLIIDGDLQTPSDAIIIDALRKRGYKATSQRIAICRFALRSRDHPSAGRIYKEVKEVHPTVSLATVYKTVHVLKELGLVQELAFPEREARFDSYLEPHLNLVCQQCGSIGDAEDSFAREMVRKVAARMGFTPTGQRIDVYGICRKCGKRTKTADIQTKPALVMAASPT
jgi:Fur family peroxide stress response transcriptional regulator